ncbi:SRPBCC domain-containing protein [Erwinia papayae]|uniref:SRPBCC domain-containing protein n=1 Tax=Erwinia papayae TaxID=206499 RepID=A0ABV3N3G2_9GAMM
MKLCHAIEVDASCEKVYQALTQVNLMVAWHKGRVTGEIAPGKEFHLLTEKGLDFGWRTESLSPPHDIQQICIKGPGNSVGKRLHISLKASDKGTLVTLTDGEWSEDDPHLPLCNTHWAGALHNLKSLVEGGETGK